jgi:ABC-2 type transport system ATP-binding protein
MHQVEELCRRVLVLVKGSPVLYGSLDEIRELFGTDTVLVDAHGDLTGLPGVLNVADRGRLKELELAPGTRPEEVLAALAARPELGVTHFEVHAPSLEEIFLIVAAREARSAGAAAAGPAEAGADEEPAPE